MTTPDNKHIEDHVAIAMTNSKVIGEQHEWLMKESRALVERVTEKLENRRQDD